jgi:hypothetical protein
MSGLTTRLTRDSRSVLEVLYRFEFDPPPDQFVKMLANVECPMSRPEPVSPVPEYLIDAMLFGSGTNVRAGLALLQRLALVEPGNEHVVFGEWQRADGSTVRALPAWQNSDRPPDCRHVSAVDVYLDKTPLMTCEYADLHVVPQQCWRLTPDGATAGPEALGRSAGSKLIAQRGRRRENDPAADEKLAGDWRASGMKQAEFEHHRGLDAASIARAVDRVRKRQERRSP